MQFQSPSSNDPHPHAHEASSTTAAAATAHPEAASAARDVLARGGNAVDAAVGAILALCVVTPSQVGLGGYGGSMVLYRARDRKLIALDFDSCAPIAFRPELFAGNTRELTLNGYLSLTVPAVVAGLTRALRDFGTMTWRDVSQYAIALAEGGFPIDARLKTQLDTWAAKADERSRRAYVPGGVVPEVGQTWVQKSLAVLLRRLGDEGPESFYTGEIARQIVAQVRENGGILNEADFAEYRTRLVEPLTTRYRNLELVTPPPPSGGITTLQIMKILEHFDIAAMGRWSGTYFHHLAEATKLAWRDRNRWLGDPDRTQIPTGEMLSETRSAELAQLIRPDRILASEKPAVSGGEHTANIVAVDRERNVVSITATLGFIFGSTVVIEGLGIVLGHGMSRFDFVAGHPNAPEPRKRMHHNMVPMLVLDEGGTPRWGFGLPGGAKIIDLTANLIASVVDFGATPGQAVTSPRIHTAGEEPLEIAPDVPEQTVRELAARGHGINRVDHIGGPANAVEIRADRIIAANSEGARAVVAL
jgi:gamma-glutamyltranspeptidase